MSLRRFLPWIGGLALLASGIPVRTLASPPAFVPAVIGFWDAQHGIAAEGDRVATTDDGGGHWVDRQRGLAVDLLRVSGGSTAWIVSGSKVYESDDRGRAWHPVGTSKKPLLALSTARVWWALGGEQDRRRLYQTQDAGGSWHPSGWPCGSNPAFGLVSLQFVSLEKGWALCGGCPATIMMCKAIFETSDGGASWHTKMVVGFWRHEWHSGGIGATGHPAGIFFLPDGHGWYWEDRGHLYRTADAGVHWQMLNLLTPDASALSSAAFVSDNVGFAVLVGGGHESQFIETRDAGVTWRSPLP
jgi:photosystem II stability/assembly factor-like uncharacterized protein